jgi:Zn-finger nucleic acid-binding protein
MNEMEANMQCPVDNTVLAMAERYGIEIDYCPECRGIWLDRGELDKIITRAQADIEHGDQHAGDHRRDEPTEPQKHKKQGRLSFLSDLMGEGGD